MSLAVIIPCYNEELTIEKVVRDAHRYLPQAQVYVFDNNSTDQTRMRAQKAGAIVLASPRQGKGHVVRHAFREVDADIYLMLDGDDTYPLEHARRLIEEVEKNQIDMAVGARLNDFSPGAFRRFHLFGNKLFSLSIRLFFGERIQDMFSGYRAFSRAFVDQVPLDSKGFEVETDLTLQAISKGFAIKEIPLPYRNRPQGSFSKLRTYEDGFLILRFLLRLVKDYRPLPFFCMLSALCFMTGLIAGWAPIQDYLQYAYVYTLPRAVLAASMMILSCLLLGVGLILDSQVRYFREQFLMLQKITAQQTRKAHVATKARAG